MSLGTAVCEGSVEVLSVVERAGSRCGVTGASFGVKATDEAGVGGNSGSIMVVIPFADGAGDCIEPLGADTCESTVSAEEVTLTVSLGVKAACVARALRSCSSSRSHTMPSRLT